MTPGRLLFAAFEVTSQAFYTSPKSFAIVNLKPIVPGHVLVIPKRPVPRLADLDSSELSSLMHSIQHVSSIIQKVYAADALTIACQDGKAAGQSVPHVHFHILPRKSQSPPSQGGEDPFAGEKNDQIYPALEANEASLSATLERAQTPPTFIKVDADEDRKPRSLEEMEQEANWLKGFFITTSPSQS